MVTAMRTMEAVPEIAAATRMGPVHYTVADLGRQSNFYQERLGFKLHWREGRSAGLGAGGVDLLRLTEQPGVRPMRGTTGLYHTAFLLPTRLALAQVLLNIAHTRTPIEGGANHGTHLAVYLPDAEGNGIEMAWDFPQEIWKPIVDVMRRGDLAQIDDVIRQPLDFEGLLNEAQAAAAPWAGLPAASQVGHVHLRVADLDETARFYHDMLGFETLFNLLEMGAAFFSAGGYHHHIGTNIWNSAGRPPASAEATGLRDFTIVLPDQAELGRALERLERAGRTYERSTSGVRLSDPAGIGVRLVVDGSPESAASA